MALLTCGLLAAQASVPLHARGQRTVVGATGGWATTTQRWKPSRSTEDYGGLMLGMFADAATPVPWLVVRGELTYTRRGGDVFLDFDFQDTEPPLGPARIRMDYLTVVVHGKLQWVFGPLSAHFSFGPTLDQVLRRRMDPLLSQILEEETATVFSVAVGGGVGSWVTEWLHVAFDVRLTEGLSPAHEGNFSSVRNRSFEGFLSVGIPLALIRER
jgi:hypothetical protein